MIPSGMPQASVTLPPSSGEVLEADVGDVRLTQRAALLLDCLADHAGESFPKVLDESDIEGAYRFSATGPVRVNRALRVAPVLG